MRVWAGAVLAALAVSMGWAGTGTALAQAPASVTGAPSAQALDEAILAIEETVRERYVDTEKKATVLAALAEGRASGRYRGVPPEEVAARLTADLKRSSNDGHMYVNWAPAEIAALNAGRGPGPGSGPRGPDPAWAERTLRRNSGLSEMKILAGDVRYVRLEAFLWDEASSPAAYDDAMTFLKGGEAAIIDLRGNGGGSPAAVRYLTSHFVPAGTHLMTFQMAGVEERSTTAAQAPAAQMVGKPLYVLIDRGVGSAGEEFALHVDRFKIGELVGETTGGAGNRNALFVIPPGFRLSVSVGRAKHATDGSSWEGVGVKAHHATAPEKAQQAAHLRALERLAAGGPQARRAEYAWVAEGLRAELQGAKPAAGELARLEGVYGERRVWLKEGTLAYQRSGGRELALKPLTRDTFAVVGDEQMRVRFEPSDGAAKAITLLYSDGRTTRLDRTS